jgi:hypothetical protein
VAIEVVDGSCEQLVEFLAEQQLDTVLTIVGGNDLKFASRFFLKSPTCWLLQKTIGSRSGKV